MLCYLFIFHFINVLLHRCIIHLMKQVQRMIDFLFSLLPLWTVADRVVCFVLWCRKKMGYVLTVYK